MKTIRLLTLVSVMLLSFGCNKNETTSETYNYLTIKWDGLTAFDLQSVVRVDLVTEHGTIQCFASEGRVYVSFYPDSIVSLVVHRPDDEGTILIGSDGFDYADRVISITS